MFSPEKIIYSFIDNNNKKSIVNLPWKNLFKELYYIIYFQDHLIKHLYKPGQITICLQKNMNIGLSKKISSDLHIYPSAFLPLPIF